MVTIPKYGMNLWFTNSADFALVFKALMDELECGKLRSLEVTGNTKDRRYLAKMTISWCLLPPDGKPSFDPAKYDLARFEVREG